eukprot:PhM_4_TR6008/c0_g1_i1/m.39178
MPQHRTVPDFPFPEGESPHQQVLILKSQIDTYADMYQDALDAIAALEQRYEEDGVQSLFRTRSALMRTSHGLMAAAQTLSRGWNRSLLWEYYHRLQTHAQERIVSRARENHQLATSELTYKFEREKEQIVENMKESQSRALMRINGSAEKRERLLVKEFESDFRAMILSIGTDFVQKSSTVVLQSQTEQQDTVLVRMSDLRISDDHIRDVIHDIEADCRTMLVQMNTSHTQQLSEMERRLEESQKETQRLRQSLDDFTAATTLGSDANIQVVEIDAYAIQARMESIVDCTKEAWDKVADLAHYTITVEARNHQLEQNIATLQERISTEKASRLQDHAHFATAVISFENINRDYIQDHEATLRNEIQEQHIQNRSNHTESKTKTANTQQHIAELEQRIHAYNNREQELKSQIEAIKLANEKITGDLNHKNENFRQLMERSQDEVAKTEVATKRSVVLEKELTDAHEAYE